jgi:hypothetical protein
MTLRIRNVALQCGGLLAALLLAAPPGRADQIGFEYNFLTPQAVTGDQGNLGAITFATAPAGHAGGHSILTAASLAAVTAAPLTSPDTFSGQPYTLTLQLTDDPSGKSGTLTFTGRLFGTLTPIDANITTSFDAATKSLRLGSDTYTVSLGPLNGPATLNPTVVGTLMATVDVQAGGGTTGPSTQVEQAPEPSALALAGAGLALAAAAWRRSTIAPVC